MLGMGVQAAGRPNELPASDRQDLVRGQGYLGEPLEADVDRAKQAAQAIRAWSSRRTDVVE